MALGARARAAARAGFADPRKIPQGVWRDKACPPSSAPRARLDLLSPFLLVAAGFVLLFAGAEGLVRGASRLARGLGISPLVVGLTVVAIGTSSPEIVVTVQSVLEGRTELAVGNVVGSNIFNVLFILGLSALAVPLVVARGVVRRDAPILLGVSLLVWALALDGRLARLEGLVLLLLAAAYTGWLVRGAMRAPQGGAGDEGDGGARGEGDRDVGAEPDKSGPLKSLLLLAGGLVIIVTGSSWLISGAVEIARAQGVSELVLGLTLVAGGTSLPEVAASLVAALRGERDIAVANVVGSCLYNLMLILGAGAALAPGGLPIPAGTLGLDIPVMTATAAACLPIFFSGWRIARWEGAFFLAYYVAYVAVLVMGAVDHAALPLVSGVMLSFVVPLTVVTLLVVGIREWRAGRGGPGSGRGGPGSAERRGR